MEVNVNKVLRNHCKLLHNRRESGLTKRQELIKLANSLRTDNYYVVSKIEPGQQKIITCVECKKETDLSESVEYGAAVQMFIERDGMCVGCYYKKTGEMVY